MNNKTGTGKIIAAAMAAFVAASSVDAAGEGPSNKRRAPEKNTAVTVAAKPSIPPSLKAAVRKVEQKLDEVQAYWDSKCPTVSEPERQAYVAIDSKTGEVLIGKDEDITVQIASMTKLMTGLLAYEAIQSGKISEDTLVKIDTVWNRRANGNPITRVLTQWVKPVPIKDVIAAAIIGSKNDAAVTLAKIVGGTEADFVQMMNARARELGFKMTFFNSTGLPIKDVDHLGVDVPENEKGAALKDVARLHKYILETQPDLARLMGSHEKNLQGKVLPHTLSKLFQSLSSLFPEPTMKSGFACIPGFSATVSAGETILSVIGYKTPKQRDEEIPKLLEHAQNVWRLNKQLPIKLEAGSNLFPVLAPNFDLPLREIKFDIPDIRLSPSSIEEGIVLPDLKP